MYQNKQLPPVNLLDFHHDGQYLFLNFLNRYVNKNRGRNKKPLKKSKDLQKNK